MNPVWLPVHQSGREQTKSPSGDGELHLNTGLLGHRSWPVLQNHLHAFQQTLLKCVRHESCLLGYGGAAEEVV